MKKRGFITLHIPSSKQEIIFEVPADRPISEWIPDLIKALNSPPWNLNQSLSYHLRTESGQILSGNLSLRQTDINNFEHLWISLEEEPAPTIPTQKELDNLSSTRENSIRSPQLFFENLTIEYPSLISKEGIVFVIGQPPIVIGRRSKDFIPNIDLTELDKNLIVSRRHAEILLEEKGYYLLRALNTRNGTFVNGVEIKPNEIRRLENRDTILFGFGGVTLVFRLP